jgi:flagellin-like hook-associated protein FlgL
MPIVINTNSSATVSAFNLARNNTALQKSLARLSSGSRIVNPSDDAGGLAVSYKLTAQVHRLDAVRQNVANGVSFLQVQDGALTVVGNILDRISELKTMSMDVTKNATDRANYDTEVTELQQQLGNIMVEKFNGINLFDKDDSPVPIYTTEDGVTGKVDITRNGLFENLDARNLKELELNAKITMVLGGDKLSTATTNEELTGFKANETVTFTFHGGTSAARATAVADADGVIANGLQLTVLDGGQGFAADPTAVYADQRAEDSVAPIKEWINGTAYVNGDVVKLDGKSYVVQDAVDAATDNTGKNAFKALAQTVELQNTTEPRAKVLQYGATADTYTVGEVVYNDRDANYYMVAGAGADYATATTALGVGDQIDTQAGAFVKLGSDLANVADHNAWDSGESYNQGDIVSFRDSAGKLRLYVATSASVTVGATDPEVDTDGKWTELSQYKTEGADLLDESSSLSDFSVASIVDFIQTLATARAQNGAESKHLQYADEMLVQNRTNIEAANSRIKDVDVAIESTNYARNNILVQSSAAMLAQANTMASIALSLLGQ